jgi:Tol biopolymer transport system component
MQPIAIRIIGAIALLCAAASIADAQPTVVSPFPRSLSGMLAFQSDARTANNPNGRTRIYTLNLDAGSIAALTADSGDWNDEQPRWSPDGRRIVFTSNRGGSYNLYAMDGDGRNVTRLTNHAGNDRDAVWLPDGQSLVFGSDRDRGQGRSDLYRMSIADGAVERLTVFFEGNPIMPSVSPDGNWVAFAAMTFPSAFGWTYQVHVLELATRMTWPFDVAGHGCWPNWSPDGQSIAHVLLDQEPSRIQVISSFGTSPEPVAGEPARWHYYPDWSPDGSLLAVAVSPEHHEGEDWDLAIVDPSRSLPPQRLTTGAGNDRLPDWKPR